MLSGFVVSSGVVKTSVSWCNGRPQLSWTPLARWSMCLGGCFVQSQARGWEFCGARLGRGRGRLDRSVPRLALDSAQEFPEMLCHPVSRWDRGTFSFRAQWASETGRWCSVRLRRRPVGSRLGWFALRGRRLLLLKRAIGCCGRGERLVRREDCRELCATEHGNSQGSVEGMLAEGLLGGTLE